RLLHCRPLRGLRTVSRTASYRFGDGRGFLVTTRYASAPSVISMDWSAARPRKVWVVLLVGQVTVRQSTESASRRPINSTRLLPPKLPLLPMTRWIERVPPGPFRSTRSLAPRADRLVLVPMSRTLSQWRPCPGFWNNAL